MKLLIADAIDDAAIATMREAGVEVDIKLQLTTQQLLTEIVAYNAIVIRSRTKVTSHVIEAGKKLQLIVRAGVGLDNVDLIAAAEKRIEIRNTPHATTISVAEHTLAMMLALARHIPAAHAKLTNGIWDKKSFEGVELFGKQLGIIGYGRIGREVAARAKAFGMSIVANDPLLEANHVDVPLLPLEELLSGSDIVSLHLPAAHDTKNLLDPQRLALMKPTAFLINGARGGLVDETAVAAALKEGKIAGAAFDVFAVEPLISSPLMGLSNAILIPHLGASTVEAQRRASTEIARIVVEFTKTHQK